MQTLFNALNAHNIPTPNRSLNNSGITRWGKNARYWAIRLGNDGWCFGDWSTGARHYAFAEKSRPITHEERHHLNELLKAEKEKFEQAQRLRQARAAEDAYNLLEIGTPAQDCGHTYLSHKSIGAVSEIYVNKEDPTLLIPLFDSDNTLWNIQTIYTDGTKRFLPGGRIKGCFHIIGTIGNRTNAIVCEGYATGASIYEATGIPVIVAFCAMNIEQVIKSVLNRRPDLELIIAADNDRDKSTNTGRDTAIAVGKKFGLTVIVPQFPADTKGMSDFNDLHKNYGIDAVKQQFSKGGITC